MLKYDPIYKKKSDFWYDLPKKLIAQHPVEPRDASRLLCLDRKSGTVTDSVFNKIEAYLRPGDLLVVNDSKVLPARLIGKKAVTHGEAELLLLKDLGNDCWECLARPGKRLHPGAAIEFCDGLLRAEVCEELPEGRRAVRFHYDSERVLGDILDEIGSMPLPPYITESLKDKNRYQTVYAENIGSSAAPTAGLHFTDHLLNTLKEKGVGIARVTLHVGLGTFRPVKEDYITDHVMHSEWFTVPSETADAIKTTKEQGGRIIAVGTTSCRTLEAAAAIHGSVIPCAESTNLFIYPGYKFRCVDGLITNFHLPESTLLMLVSAFAGYDSVMNAYRHAVQEEYRFFSFGDAMLIL